MDACTHVYVECAGAHITASNITYSLFIMPSFWNIAFAIVVCLSVYLFYTARDVPTLPVSGGGLSLGKGGYDIQGVIAPVATGTILEVFSSK